MLDSFLPNALDLRCIAGQGDPFVIWNPFGPKGRKRRKGPDPWAKTLAEASDSSDAGGRDGRFSLAYVLDGAGDMRVHLLHDFLGGTEPENDIESDIEGDPEHANDSDSSMGSAASLQGLVADVPGASQVAAPVRNGSASGPSTSSSSSSNTSSSSSSSGSDSEGQSDTPPLLQSPPEVDEGPRVHDFIGINRWTTITFFGLGRRRDFIAKCIYPGHHR